MHQTHVTPLIHNLTIHKAGEYASPNIGLEPGIVLGFRDGILLFNNFIFTYCASGKFVRVTQSNSTKFLHNNYLLV